MTSKNRKRARLRVHEETHDDVTLDDFTLLQAPHPYGVLPLGNRYYSNELSETRRNTEESNGCSSSCCTNQGYNPIDLLNSEECWNTILSYMDGVSLAISIAPICHFFYVASNQPELWRDLVLIQCNNQRSSSNGSSCCNSLNKKSDRDISVIHQVGPTWKDTYAIMYITNRNKKENKDNTDSNTVHVQYQPHTPIPMKGRIYSDYYYRLHSCRAFSIPKSWYITHSNTSNNKKNTVTTIPIEHMTSERFFNEFEQRNIPVNIQGACLSWDAYTKWQDVSYIQQHTMHQTFRATSGVAPYPAQFTFSAYRNYCVGFNTNAVNNEVPTTTGQEENHVLLEEGPLYLFDRTALRPHSVLWNDYMNDLQRTCPFWDPNMNDKLKDNGVNDSASGGHDLFGLLGEGRRPDHTWLICGPQRSGSVFHIDPNGTHAWNATICGRKRWIFYPPGVSPPGVYPSDDGDEVALPLTIGEWIFQYWEEHCDRKRNDHIELQPIECTTMPGDVIFVPHGWWHFVINLDEWNVAITHNYVSLSNLSNCLRFLNEKRDQVSGCRDRDESIKPERLYEEFVAVLNHHHPKWLKQALVEPDWTCNAWKSKTIRDMKVNQQSNLLETNYTSNSDDTRTISIIKKAKIEGVFEFSFDF